MSLHITLNGEEHSLPHPMSIREMLEYLQLPTNGVAVEKNRAIVPKSRHGDEPVADGDQIEMIHFVGGG